jgi:hypothetical protein
MVKGVVREYAATIDVRARDQAEAALVVFNEWVSRP